MKNILNIKCIKYIMLLTGVLALNEAHAVATFRLQNQHTGRCLSLVNPVGSNASTSSSCTASGTAFLQSEFPNFPNLVNGRIKLNSSTSKCAASTSSTNVLVSTCSTSSHQNWNTLVAPGACCVLYTTGKGPSWFLVGWATSPFNVAMTNTFPEDLRRHWRIL